MNFIVYFTVLTVVSLCVALQVVFGSLYRDDVLIKPSRVISVLAAACMLQLDGLIQQCAETMKENISAKTVCGYYASASIYGLDSVMKKSELHLLSQLQQCKVSPTFLGNGCASLPVFPSLTSLYRCHDWLLNNLMTHQNVDLMKELGYVCA